MIDVYVANIGRYLSGAANDGIWVSFPAKPSVLNKTLDEIGVGVADEYFTPAAESSELDGLASVIGEYESLGQINALARALVLLDENDLQKVEAILDLESPSLPQLMMILEVLDDYDFWPDIHTDEDLGRYCVDELGALNVPDHLRNYIDYEAYGRDIRLESSGGFAAGGFLFTP